MNRQVRMVKSSVTAKHEIVFERKWLDLPSSVHWHDFCELDIIVSGHGISYVNGRECVCQKGMMVFSSPSDVHDYQANELEIFNIQFSVEGVDSDILHTLMQMKNRVVYMEKEDYHRIFELCCLMERTVLEDNYRGMFQKRILENMLILFLQNAEANQTEMSRTDVDVIQNVVIYIHGHFSENPMLKDVAKEFHLNENYLCALFHQYTGEKYKSYLRRIKLEHAEKLISYTNTSMTEIALSCGYSTQSHFNREFKALFQMTPNEMRKSVRER